MNSENLARRTQVEITFDGADITESIQPYLLSVIYTDNEDGETDDLQIKVQDRESEWLQWLLDKAIQAAAGKEDSPGESGESAAAQAGEAVVLDNAAFYYTSTTPNPSCRKSGTFYFYDGILINGRYRMTNTPERCGKKPVGKNVTGWVDAEDCGGGNASAEGTGGDSSGSSGGAISGGTLKISAAMTQIGWENDATLPSGDFELDSVTADGPPATATIKGTSLPFRSPIRQTKKSKAWESYKLSGIAGQIAADNGLACVFESSYDPFYERVEQRKTSDSAFLEKLCKDAGISIKASDGQLVLFDQAKYEAKPPVLTIRRGKSGYTSYSLRTSAADCQYNSCRVSYVNPGSGKCIEGTYTADAEKTGQCLEITAKVSSVAEAKALAEKRLRLHNKFTRFVSFTFPGNPALVAGVTVQLEDWGGWDGKYLVKQAVHTVSGSGYTTKITARRCLEGY